MLWSICICTVPQRIGYLGRLLLSIEPCIYNSFYKTSGFDDIEILICSDEAKMTIGQKRNLLVRQAVGKYISFIDDDDTVADDYVPTIRNELLKDPDCVGFLKQRYIDDKLEHLSKHSFEYSEIDWNTRPIEVPINHLNPVRADLVRQVPFKNISFGEDTDYSYRLHPLLKSEGFINKVLYNYYIRSNKAELPVPNIQK